MAEKNTKNNKWRKQYDDSKANLAKLNGDLKQLYGIKDLENRAYQFKVLKEQYGMDLGVYHQKQVDKLNESKHILTSRYYVPSPNQGNMLVGGILVNKPLSYTSDVNASAEGIEMYSGKKITVNETRLNPDYDKTLDLKSEYHVKLRKEDGGTYEADFKTQKDQEFTEAFNYGTAGNTDAWGRDYDHPDFGVDPSNVNRVTNTPTPTSGDNNNNKVEKPSNNNSNTSALNLSSSINTNLGAKDGDLIASNPPGEPPKNRLELMTKEIAENPSRIQKGLMGIEKAGDTPTTGWTPERLAGLKIKHQDWKENRNKIKVKQPVKA